MLRRADTSILFAGGATLKPDNKRKIMLTAINNDYLKCFEIEQ